MRLIRTLIMFSAVFLVVGLMPLAKARAEFPYAPVELRLAQNELDSARTALDVREYERARRLAEQALSDARVAEARAETFSARQTAHDLYLGSATLRDEAMRASASIVYLPPYSSPFAPTELRLAREELDSARTALDVREYNRARRLAEQALSDARVAEVRAGTLSTRESARDLRISSEAVRDEALRMASLY